MKRVINIFFIVMLILPSLVYAEKCTDFQVLKITAVSDACSDVAPVPSFMSVPQCGTPFVKFNECHRTVWSVCCPDSEFASGGSVMKYENSKGNLTVVTAVPYGSEQQAAKQAFEAWKASTDAQVQCEAGYTRTGDLYGFYYDSELLDNGNTDVFVTSWHRIYCSKDGTGELIPMTDLVSGGSSGSTTPQNNEDLANKILEKLSAQGVNIQGVRDAVKNALADMQALNGGVLAQSDIDRLATAISGASGLKKSDVQQAVSDALGYADPNGSPDTRDSALFDSSLPEEVEKKSLADAVSTFLSGNPVASVINGNSIQVFDGQSFLSAQLWGRTITIDFSSSESLLHIIGAAIVLVALIYSAWIVLGRA